MSSLVALDTGVNWPETLLQGSVAAVVGLVGLFVVFWLTAKHERGLEQARVQVEAARSGFDRSARAAAAVVQATTRLGGLHGLNERDHVRELADALVMLCFSEIQDHPRAANWAMYKARDLTHLVLSDHHPKAIPWEAGYAAALFTQWAENGFEDDSIFPEVPPTELPDASDAPTTPAAE